MLVPNDQPKQATKQVIKPSTTRRVPIDKKLDTQTAKTDKNTSNKIIQISNIELSEGKIVDDQGRLQPGGEFYIKNLFRVYYFSKV